MIAIDLFDQLDDDEDKRELNNREITALLLYRYHLSRHNKDTSYRMKNLNSFKKISSFILDNELDDDDLPNVYNTYDDSMIKVIVRELNGGHKSKRINNRKRYS